MTNDVVGETQATAGDDAELICADCGQPFIFTAGRTGILRGAGALRASTVQRMPRGETSLRSSHIAVMINHSAATAASTSMAASNTSNTRAGEIFMRLQRRTNTPGPGSHASEFISSRTIVTVQLRDITSMHGQLLLPETEQCPSSKAEES
jgi:hypothetical protein